MIIAAADRIGRSQIPIWHRAGDVPQDLGSTVVTLGVFDGMHHGHAHLVGRAVAAARERRLPAVLVTFDPHPAAVLGLPKDHARLSSVERRAELAGRLGIDAVFVVDFTAQVARQSPQCFVDELLVRTLRARAVVLGSNFTFGHRGAGTVDTMRTLGRVAGFTTEMVELAGHRDVVSSSSRVRACLHRGDLAGAARVLGRPHRIEGHLDPVELYDAAFVPASGSAVPGPGRYAARLVGGDGLELTVTEEGTLLVQGPHAAAPASLELAVTAAGGVISRGSDVRTSLRVPERREVLDGSCGSRSRAPG